MEARPPPGPSRRPLATSQGLCEARWRPRVQGSGRQGRLPGTRGPGLPPPAHREGIAVLVPTAASAQGLALWGVQAGRTVTVNGGPQGLRSPDGRSQALSNGCPNRYRSGTRRGRVQRAAPGPVRLQPAPHPAQSPNLPTHRARAPAPRNAAFSSGSRTPGTGPLHRPWPVLCAPLTWSPTDTTLPLTPPWKAARPAQPDGTLRSVPTVCRTRELS